MDKKVAVDGSIAGGAIIASATKTFAEGRPVALDGDPVTPHGTGLHAAATMQATSTSVIVEGKRVVRSGDSATCGDTVTDISCAQTVLAGD